MSDGLTWDFPEEERLAAASLLALAISSVVARAGIREMGTFRPSSPKYLLDFSVHSDQKVAKTKRDAAQENLAVSPMGRPRFDIL